MEMCLNSIIFCFLAFLYAAHFYLVKCEKSLSELLNDGGRNCLMGPGKHLVWKIERKATICLQMTIVYCSFYLLFYLMVLRFGVLCAVFFLQKNISILRRIEFKNSCAENCKKFLILSEKTVKYYFRVYFVYEQKREIY